MKKTKCRYYENLAVVPFTEDFKVASADTKFEAASFRKFIDRYSILAYQDYGSFEILPKTLSTYSWQTQYAGGMFAIGDPRYLPNYLAVFQGSKQGRVCFSGSVNIPVARDGKRVWMSLTPMEVATCRPGIRRAKGHVFIAGVGLGYMAQKILEKQSVTAVTLCDNNQSLLEAVEKALLDKYPHKSIEAVCENAYSAVYNFPCDSVSFDIWPSYGRAYRDRNWRDVKAWATKQGISAWGWGDIKNIPSR